MHTSLARETHQESEYKAKNRTLGEEIDRADASPPDREREERVASARQVWK